MRWPLRYQIMVPMATVMLLAVIFVEGVGALLSVHDTKSQIAAQVREVARIARDANFPLTNAVLQQMKSLSGANLIVVDETGRTIASSDPGEDIEHLSQLEALPAQKSLLGQDTVRAKDRSYFHSVVTLRAFDRLQPTKLHILYPEEEYHRAWQREVYPPIGFVAVALPIVLLLSIVTASRIAGRVVRLHQQVDQIADGDFQQLELPKGDDEIRSLARAVNRMAAMLAGYEQQVRRTERMATLASLGGGMAHQLRNSATGCAMAVDLHAEECPLGASSDNLQMAKRQLQLMEQYIQRFLQLGKASDSADLQEVDFAALVNDLVPLVEPAARHAGVDLLWTGSDVDAWLTGDMERLRQMAINLMINAIEAAAHNRARLGGSAKVYVELARPEARRILFTVSDTGSGPIDRVQHTLFEPFVTDKPNGVGLGLSVALEVAQQHGGQITWRRADNLTFFTVELASDVSLPGRAAAIAPADATLTPTIS